MTKKASIHTAGPQGGPGLRGRGTYNGAYLPGAIPVVLPSFDHLKGEICEKLKYPLKTGESRLVSIDLIRRVSSITENNTIFLRDEIYKLMRALCIQGDEWDFTDENLILSTPESIRIFKGWILGLNTIESVLADIRNRLRRIEEYEKVEATT